MKHNNIRFKTLHDLKQYRIGVLKGAVHGKEFDEADYLNKNDVLNRELNIRKLQAGRIDLMAGPKDVVFHELQRDYPELVDEIRVLSPPIGKNDVYICVSKKRKGYKQLIESFNSKLSEVKADGTYERIMRKHGLVNVQNDS